MTTAIIAIVLYALLLVRFIGLMIRLAWTGRDPWAHWTHPASRPSRRENSNG